MNTRLKKIRMENKLSQEEFGKRIGIESRGHISSLENGTKNITDRIINDVCREFGYREEWLRDGIEPKQPVIDEDIEYGQICAELGITDTRAKQVIMNYGKMSSEDKELFWSFINRLVESEKNDH